MEQELNDILTQYNNLLKSYEKMYESFKALDCTNIDEYISILWASRQHIELISETQKKIGNLRQKLKAFIGGDLLLDSVIDGFSGGRVGYINDRIEYIISRLKQYEEEGRAALQYEYVKLQNGLKNSEIQ